LDSIRVAKIVSVDQVQSNVQHKGNTNIHVIII